MWFTLGTHLSSEHTAQVLGGCPGAGGLCPGQRGQSRRPPDPRRAAPPTRCPVRLPDPDPAGLWPVGPVVGGDVTRTRLASPPLDLIPAFRTASRGPLRPRLFGARLFRKIH